LCIHIRSIPGYFCHAPNGLKSDVQFYHSYRRFKLVACFGEGTRRTKRCLEEGPLTLFRSNKPQIQFDLEPILFRGISIPVLSQYYTEPACGLLPDYIRLFGLILPELDQYPFPRLSNTPRPTFAPISDFGHGRLKSTQQAVAIKLCELLSYSAGDGCVLNHGRIFLRPREVCVAGRREVENVCC
jgi:hypothetical protein